MITVKKSIAQDTSKWLRKKGGTKREVLMGDNQSFVGAEKLVGIANGCYQEKHRIKIRGSGYVVESLEAALWCFLRTDTFEEAILLASNLGDDADTTAAVCGQIAGAHYGTASIPVHWLNQLAMRSDIIELADRLRDGDGDGPGGLTES